jgi:hypothetical protein
LGRNVIDRIIFIEDIWLARQIKTADTQYGSNVELYELVDILCCLQCSNVKCCLFSTWKYDG